LKFTYYIGTDVGLVVTNSNEVFSDSAKRNISIGLRVWNL